MKRMLIFGAVLFILGGIQLSLAGPIGQIKASSKDGDIICISGVVTAQFNDCMYIQDRDGIAGIRVRGILGTEGIEYGFDQIRVRTGSDGEKELQYIPATAMFGIYAGDQTPVYLANKCLGGGDFHYNKTNHQGQCGVFGCNGLNNIGLLITISGRVTACSGLYGSFFYIDDGSRRRDGSGNTGIKVSWADFPPGGPYIIPKVGWRVAVTGISTVTMINGKIQSMIRLRRQNDISFISW